MYQTTNQIWFHHPNFSDGKTINKIEANGFIAYAQLYLHFKKIKSVRIQQPIQILDVSPRL
jgi:hypothetical protein